MSNMNLTQQSGSTSRESLETQAELTKQANEYQTGSAALELIRNFHKGVADVAREASRDAKNV